LLDPIEKATPARDANERIPTLTQPFGKINMQANEYRLM
jgi:hypothetical protein